MVRSLWLVIGLVSLALGIAGVVGSSGSTTPFVLLAAYCFARSSPRLHDWLLANPRLGPLIANWERHRAIAPRAKLLAVLSMAGVFALALALGASDRVLIIQAVILPVTALFILTRPDGPKPGG